MRPSQISSFPIRNLESMNSRISSYELVIFEIKSMQRNMCAKNNCHVNADKKINCHVKV